MLQRPDRSVSEWNKTENKKRLISLQGDGFNPYTQLCLARIAMLKMLPQNAEEQFWDIFVYGIGYAKAAEGGPMPICQNYSSS
jgi:hypothetical protein